MLEFVVLKEHYFIEIFYVLLVFLDDLLEGLWGFSVLSVTDLILGVSFEVLVEFFDVFVEG